MRHFIVGLVTLFSLHALADNAVATPSPSPSPSPTPTPLMPTLVRNEGEPIHWNFSDGRVATATIIRRAPLNLKFDIGMSDSSCPVEVATPPTCSLHAAIKTITMGVVWTAHPDAAKVGQSVKLYGNNDVRIDSFYSQFNQLYEPTTAADLPPVSLECDDFTFLTGSKDAPASFEMGSWSGEQMSTNPETGAPENLTTFGFYQPHFEKVSDREMKIVSTGPWFTSGFGGFRYWFFGSSILQFVSSPAPAHPSCQIAFKPDFTPLAQVVKDYEKTSLAPVAPYLSGSDGYYDSEQSSDFSQLKNLNSTTEDQWN